MNVDIHFAASSLLENDMNGGDLRMRTQIRLSVPSECEMIISPACMEQIKQWPSDTECGSRKTSYIVVHGVGGSCCIADSQ